jgi:hypothetical protein
MIDYQSNCECAWNFSFRFFFWFDCWRVVIRRVIHHVSRSFGVIITISLVVCVHSSNTENVTFGYCLGFIFLYIFSISTVFYDKLIQINGVTGQKLFFFAGCGHNEPQYLKTVTLEIPRESERDGRNNNLCKQYIEASICLLSIFEIGKIKQSNHVD